MAERTVNCAHCEQGFIAKRSDARYCGCNCSSAARKGKAWRRACDDCGNDISHRHGNARLCDVCSAARAKTHGLRALVCPECGVTFSTISQQIHCSTRCAGLARRRRQVLMLTDRECPACTRPFTPQGNRAVACCNPCSQWLRKHPGELRRTGGECLTCGSAFTGDHAARRFCSARCAKTAGKARRRGLLASAYVEDVYVAQLAARAQWMCGLCGLDVPRKTTARHPLSASVDHIVPISRGGQHSYANTQLAHLICNIRKGNKLLT